MTMKPRGVTTLISVIVIGAIGMSVTVALLLLGVGASRTSYALTQSNQAKALATACAEEALQLIRASTSYTGTGGLTLGQGTCSYTVTNQGGELRTIGATGTVGTIVRKVTISVIQLSPQIILSTWQEVGDI